MKVFINKITNYAYTEEEVKALYNTMKDNGVEFVNKFNEPKIYKQNDRVSHFEWLYLNGDKMHSLVLTQITI